MAMPEPRRGSALRTVLIVVVVLAMLGVIGGGVWFFFFSSSSITGVKVTTPTVPTVPPPTTSTETVEQPPAVEVPTTPVTVPPTGANVPVPGEITPSTSSEVNPSAGAVSSTTATGTGEAPVVPPPTAVAVPATEGVDTDADSLTDVEEPYYQADMAKADTNGNGYNDGIEVMNLYSPLTSGKKLADEPFMQKAAWNGWSFILPKPWTVAADPNDAAVGIVTTGGATRFTLESKSNPERLPLAAWIGAGTPASQMKSFKTKSGLDALQTADGLTTYLAAGDTVLVVTYDLNGDPSYNFRTSYAMVVNALVPPAQK